MGGLTIRYTEKKSVFIDMVNEIEEWAIDEWKKNKTLTTNGKPIYKSFPQSLELYIERLKLKAK